MVSSSCSISGTRRATLGTNPEISHEWIRHHVGTLQNIIYSTELEIKDTTDTAMTVSYIDLHLEIDSEVRFFVIMPFIICSSIDSFCLQLWYLQTFHKCCFLLIWLQSESATEIYRRGTRFELVIAHVNF